jgi:hypothetical protein
MLLFVGEGAERRAGRNVRSLYYWRGSYSAKAYARVDHSRRAVLGTKCLRSLEHWDHGFESHSSHGYLCVYSVFSLVFCVGKVLAAADYPYKESFRLCIILKFQN